jgi:hypothetical protein
MADGEIARLLGLWLVRGGIGANGVVDASESQSMAADVVDWLRFFSTGQTGALFINSALRLSALRQVIDFDFVTQTDVLQFHRQSAHQ